jgi:hypothetical protein
MNELWSWLLQVTLAKVDIDKVSEVAVQLSVSSIPAVFAIYKKETISKYAQSTCLPCGDYDQE